MERETTWMRYLLLISRKGLLGILLFFLTLIPSCRIEDERFVILDIKVFYVNETSGIIEIIDNRGSCGFDGTADAFSLILRDTVYSILPQDTLILNRTNLEYMGSPNINDIDLYDSGCYAMYLENSVCTGYPQGFHEITNYENRKKTGKNSFEFTYRFTEERKTEAGPCE